MLPAVVKETGYPIELNEISGRLTFCPCQIRSDKIGISCLGPVFAVFLYDKARIIAASDLSDCRAATRLPVLQARFYSNFSPHFPHLWKSIDGCCNLT